MKLAAVLILLPIASFAGDNAPGAHLWPEEPAYTATVHVVEVLGPVDLFALRRPLCSLDTPCIGPSQGPVPAPVPVPAPIYLLASAMVLMCCLIWKGSRNV